MLPDILESRREERGASETPSRGAFPDLDPMGATWPSSPPAAAVSSQVEGTMPPQAGSGPLPCQHPHVIEKHESVTSQPTQHRGASQPESGLIWRIISKGIQWGISIII